MFKNLFIDKKVNDVEQIKKVFVNQLINIFLNILK